VSQTLIDPRNALKESNIKDLRSEELKSLSTDINYNPNLFLPKNFEKFILTGAFNRFDDSLLETGKGEKVRDAIFITGCGRSGTTLMFTLLSKFLWKTHLCLNEPREIFINSDLNFDIWSKAAAERGNSPSFLIQKPERVSEWISYIADGREGGYIEKMPEHILRVEELRQALPEARFLYL
jgi:hypothetical protein